MIVGVIKEIKNNEATAVVVILTDGHENASKEYSAGTAQMKSYDADRERMQLSLTWNSDLKTIFPEIFYFCYFFSQIFTSFKEKRNTFIRSNFLLFNNK